MKKQFLLLLTACASLLLLSACKSTGTISVNPTTGLITSTGSGSASGTIASALQQLGTFTVTDINNALALAKAATPPDTDAMQCFTYLGPYVAGVQAQLNAPSLKVSGAFSGFEAGRIAISNGQSIANSGLPPALNTACAPLVMDAVTTVNMLALKIGGSAVLPGIPALP